MSNAFQSMHNNPETMDDSCWDLDVNPSIGGKSTIHNRVWFTAKNALCAFADPGATYCGIDVYGNAVAQHHNGCMPGTEEHLGLQLQRSLERSMLLHPLYPKLIEAFCNCRKVGLGNAKDLQSIDERKKRVLASISTMRDEAYARGVLPPMDSELDVFMDKYVQAMEAYRFDLVTLYQEADRACRDFEGRINQVLQRAVQMDGSSGDGAAAASSSQVAGHRDSDGSDAAALASGCNMWGQQEEDTDHLKSLLKRKYADKIRELHEEFTRKRKKGKLPGDATNLLKAWWHENLSWPYPTDEVKRHLSDQTGLSATQINNWFINQRKRHWHKFFPEGQPQNPEEAHEMLRQQGII